MSISTLLTSAVTITSRGSATTDSEGRTTYGSVTATTVCHLQPGVVEEAVDGGLRTSVSWVAWFPEGTEIAAGDTFTVDGVTYAVEGPAKPWAPPSGSGVAHVEVRAVRRSG